MSIQNDIEYLSIFFQGVNDNNAHQAYLRLIAEVIKDKKVENMKDVFLLMADGDGTMRSANEPFGVAVTSESEAELFVKEGGVGYTHSYQKLRVFDSKDDAIEFTYPGYKERCRKTKE